MKNNKSNITPEDVIGYETTNRILAGGNLNGTKSEDCGTFAELVRSLNDAEATQRPQILEAVLKANPALAQLWGGLDKSPPDSWQFQTLADAYAPRPPLQYVVDGLLQRPSLSILYGPPGGLKSFLMADMAVSVASGLAWLEHLPDAEGPQAFMTTQGPAMWLDFDNGLNRTHERFEALGRARALSPDTPLVYVSMPSPWLDAGSLDSMGDLAQRLEDRGIALLVVDNLALVSGNADENSVEMARVMGAFRRLAEECRVAVVLLHHQNKSNLSGRAGDRLRGHSSIEASLDLALAIGRDEQSQTVTLKATKVRGVEVYPFKAMFCYDHKTGTKELATARFWGMAIEDSTSNRAVDSAIEEIVAEHAPVNKGTLKKLVQDRLGGGGVNSIGERIDILASDGRLTCTSGDKGAKLFDLPRQ